MALVLPTSRIYSGANPLSAMYEGSTKVWEPATGAPLTHPTIVGATSTFPAANTAATTTTIAIPTPAGAVPGEGLVACVVSSGQSATDLTLPSGWARIGLPAINDAAVRILGWFFTYLSATAASSYTFTSPVAGRFGGMMWRVQNVNPTQPHTQWHAYGPRAAEVITVYGLAAGLAPTADSLYLVLAGSQVAAGQATNYTVGPAGMTHLASADFGLTSGSRSGLHVFQQNLSAGPVADTSLTLAVIPSAAASNGVVLAKA